MKIGALLGVMDEVQLLPRCIAHLRRIGVDHIIALDGGSTDGSLALLRGREGEGLQLHPVPPDALADAGVASDFETALVRGSGCDWIICLDADELWLPATGALRDGPQWHDERVEMITVPRFNVVPEVQGDPLPAELTPAHHDQLWLFAGQLPDFRTRLDSEPGLPWASNAPKAKIAVRPSRVGRMLTGWHSAQGPAGEKLRRQGALDVIAAHLPFTTLQRFQQKVGNIRRLFAAHPECFAPDGAWHWWRWATLDSPQAVEREFMLQCVPAAERPAWHREGRIRSAAELLQSLR